MLNLQVYPYSESLVIPAEPVTKFDEELEALGIEMLKAAKQWNGVGLAAPQVDVSKRIIVAQAADGSWNTLVNPRITWYSNEKELGREGCLSLPGITIPNIERSKTVKVQYQDIYGFHTSLLATDFAARVLQHEIDHLDGWLYPFYLIPGAVKGEFKPLVWDLVDCLTKPEANVDGYLLRPETKDYR